MFSRFTYIRARLSMSYTDFEDEMSYSEFILICIQWYNTSLLFVYRVNSGTIACNFCSVL